VQHKMRVYDRMLELHLAKFRQMAWVTGARQVGKTESCRRAASHYLNWDNLDDRTLFLAGPAALAGRLGLNRLAAKPPVAVFDELHKFSRWQSLLKGFFDTYGENVRILVTGSSRMDVYRRGGDSLMGRYFLYRMHPFSVAEAISPELPDAARMVRAPQPISAADFAALWEHGGFPEPFLQRDAAFTTRWRNLRNQQLLREDIRETTRIQELAQAEMLARLLEVRSGGQVNYSGLATEVRVSVDTLRRWVDLLAGMHHGFLVRPWSRNVANSLRKEPKWYLRDWSAVADPGARLETMVACHLLKAVEGWNDLGLGTFALGYLRDKQKREVDFVVVRDHQPWFLVEVKTSDTGLSPALAYFQRQIQAPFAFQAVLNVEPVVADCFAKPRPPLVVPLKTLLSQLL